MFDVGGDVVVGTGVAGAVAGIIAGVAGTGAAVVLAFRCSSSHSLVWSGVALELRGFERCSSLPGDGKAWPVASPQCLLQGSLQTSTRSMGNNMSRRLGS